MVVRACIVAIANGCQVRRSKKLDTAPCIPNGSTDERMRQTDENKVSRHDVVIFHYTLNRVVEYTKRREEYRREKLHRFIAPNAGALPIRVKEANEHEGTRLG